MRHRTPVIVATLVVAAVSALGVVRAIKSSIESGHDEARQAEVIDELELAWRMDELATSVLNLSPPLKDADPIDDIVEDIGDESELVEYRLLKLNLHHDLEARVAGLIDEIRDLVEGERFDLAPADAVELSERLFGEATIVVGLARGWYPDNLADARVLAADQLAAVSRAVGTGSELDPAATAMFDNALRSVAASHDPSFLDPGVEMAWDGASVDLDGIDHLGELVITLTLAAESEAAVVDPSTAQTSALLYSIALLVSVASLGGLRAISRRADRTEMGKLRHAAGHDALTGLVNRAQFERAYQTLRPRRSRPVGVLYVDLDRFKDINDSFGHHVGDEVLRRVSQRLRERVRGGDVVGRLGGDEFAVLITGTRDIGEIIVVAERVIDALNETIVVDGDEVTIGASGGATIVTSPSVTLPAALRDADSALSVAKQQGRGRLRTSAALEGSACTPVATRL